MNARPWLWSAALVAAIAVGVPRSCSGAERHPTGATAAPSAEMVAVPGHEDARGAWIGGCWRRASRPGFVWVMPHTVEGRYDRGGWRPLAPAPQGHVWVPGHRDDFGRWELGFWRRQEALGLAWIEGRYGDDGFWRHGHWQPLEPRQAEVWVPGHVGPDGFWVEGHWRDEYRYGYAWQDGYMADGRWHWGHWRPLEPRPGLVWVPGFVKGDRWLLGHWRPVRQRGMTWIPAHWEGTRRVAGMWWNDGQFRWRADHELIRYAHYHPTIGYTARLDHGWLTTYRYAEPVRALPAGPKAAPPPGR